MTNYEDGPEPEQSLEDMQAEVVAWAQRKGWYAPDEDAETVLLKDKVNPTFGEAMALVTSEVSEALEAYRDWGLADATAAHSPSSHSPICAWRLWAEDPLKDGMIEMACDCEFGSTQKPEGVGSEFADTLIRLLHYAELFGIDLRFEFERKMAYNERRPFRHGGRAL